MQISENPRMNAFLSLRNIEQKERYSAIEIDGILKKHLMNDSDSSLYTRLVYGVLEKKLILDRIIASFSSRAPENIDKDTLMILRLGVYQILYCDRIPESAAVNESVKLACELCPKSKGFVNAVLRNLCRGKDNIIPPERKEGDIEYLSLTYSVSAEICRSLSDDYGFEKTEKMLAALCRENTTTLRVNTLKTTREKVLEELSGSGAIAESTSYSSHGIKVKNNINTLNCFEKRECFVQDESSQICVEVLGAKSGETIVDVCACPGGKSFGAAIDMSDIGRVYSFDLHENKLSLINREAENLGISIISTEKRDARVPDELLYLKADRVICDVPCSGLGVLAKKPEMRYKDISLSVGLPEIQFSILKQSTKYLKKGGVLVYSTCTLLKRENEEITDRFLRENPDFDFLDFTVGDLKSEKGRLCITPDMLSCDGFYICKMVKRR